MGETSHGPTTKKVLALLRMGGMGEDIALILAGEIDDLRKELGYGLGELRASLDEHEDPDLVGPHYQGEPE